MTHKTYFVTGDTHGQVNNRLRQLWQNNKSQYNRNNAALIILGDAGLNFFLNEQDNREKRRVQERGYIVYCLRGNHEERPENIPTMKKWYDSEVNNYVYREPQFPNIRYLIDGEVYYFNNYSALALGGAYSVDKEYRLRTAIPGTPWTGWFEGEQLTKEEMARIEYELSGRAVDFVLSHTCPISWEPRDLFLNSIPQGSIDKSMELWMEDFKNMLNWNIWLFGHFHADRLIRPGVEMLYTDIATLDSIYKRWNQGPVEWWLEKDPNYYMGVG